VNEVIDSWNLWFTDPYEEELRRKGVDPKMFTTKLKNYAAWYFTRKAVNGYRIEIGALKKLAEKYDMDFYIACLEAVEKACNIG